MARTMPKTVYCKGFEADCNAVQNERDRLRARVEELEKEVRSLTDTGVSWKTRAEQAGWRDAHSSHLTATPEGAEEGPERSEDDG